MDILGMANAIPGFLGESLNWITGLAFFLGVITQPDKLAKVIVDAIRRFAPGPVKPILLQFLDAISKGIDKAIPDDLKFLDTPKPEAKPKK